MSTVSTLANLVWLTAPIVPLVFFKVSPNKHAISFFFGSFAAVMANVSSSLLFLPLIDDDNSEFDENLFSSQMVILIIARVLVEEIVYALLFSYYFEKFFRAYLRAEKEPQNEFFVHNIEAVSYGGAITSNILKQSPFIVATFRLGNDYFGIYGNSASFVRTNGALLTFNFIVEFMWDFFRFFQISKHKTESPQRNSRTISYLFVLFCLRSLYGMVLYHMGTTMLKVLWAVAVAAVLLVYFRAFDAALPIRRSKSSEGTDE